MNKTSPGLDPRGTGPWTFLPLSIFVSGILFLFVASLTLPVLGELDKEEFDKNRKKEAQGPQGDEEEGILDPERHEELHRKLAAESDANLKEIARLMEKIQNNLAKKNTGQPTQESQKKVLKKIDELIDKLGKG